MSDDRAARRTRNPHRRYDVGLSPTVIVEVVAGCLYSANVTFEDPVAFVGNPETGKVVDALEIYRDFDTDTLSDDHLQVLDAARVAARIMDDPLFQSDVRRALKESLARCC